MAIDPVTSACTQVAVEGVVSYMKTQLGYVWNYKTNFENLRTQLQKLNDARAVVQHQVEEAKRKAGDEIEQQVVNWLARVEEITREVTIIIEGNNPANMRCFKSLCPDLKKRCQHSKEAARKTDDISKLLQEGKFDKVSYRTLPANRWNYDNYENIESRRSTLEDILNALHDPDVDMVGVYGMGGSGKTTLVREVARKAEENFLFDTVVFVEVSESVDIARIQREIAERLGLKFDEEAECVRADRLRKHLEGSKIKEETECVRADRQRKHLEESKIKEETECVGADSQRKHLEETWTMLQQLKHNFNTIYDRIVVPSIRKLTGKEGGITLLQRMGIGLVISVLTMLVSGLVEEHRRDLALTRPTLGIAPKGGAISSMSGFWLIPQLTLAGLSEAFNAIGQIEFFYKQFPENMRSIAGSSFFFGLALSSYLSGFLVSFVHHITAQSQTGRDWLPEDLNRGRLDYFYYMIASLGVLNFGYFLVCAKWYRYKGVAGGETGFESHADIKKPERHFV